MKKTTLMQSALALIAAFVLALPAHAQVESMADLFGTYKFTADVTVTDAGQSQKDNFKSECDVIITKCSYGIFDGEIQGLAGATAAQSIHSIDVTTNTIKIPNPNGGGLWNGGLYMSNPEGIYPGGGNYNDILYTFDPVTKTITLPDFTLVTSNNDDKVATIMASFTNAKLTFVEGEVIEMTDLSGDWHFTAGKGTYDVMAGSTLPTEFDMTLTATDDTKSAYNISFALGDFAPLALTATFDGVSLSIPFNETYLDAENKIGFVYYGGKEGNITFNMVKANLLSLTSGIYIYQDSISPEVPGGYLQYYTNGSAKREGGDVVTTTWDGTYTVKAGNIMDWIPEYTYPEEFEMVVAYEADYDMYFITNFMGEDVATLNYGGIQLTPSADDPNKAEIKTGAFLKTITRGEKYLCLKDGNMSNADAALILTRLEDGTYTLSDFCVSQMTYNADYTQKHDLAAWYQTVTAEKAPAAEPFTWANTFTVKVGEIEKYKEIEGYTYPTEFEMEVSYNEDTDTYWIINFLGNDVYSLNYGGIPLTVSADDPNKAEITTTNAYLKTIVAGESYLTLKDMNLQTSPITLTHNDDGTVTIDNFCVSYMTYDADWNQQHVAAALYKNVTATISEGGEEDVPVTPTKFTWADTFKVKVNDVTVYKEVEGYEYPKEFEMVVSYSEDTDSYWITDFLGNDVYDLNYGGIPLTVSADDPNKAEITTTNAYLKTIVAGESYLTLKDMNLQTSPITLTHNGDGTVTIDNFCVSYMTYDADWSQQHVAAALYSGVTATSSYANDIDEIETAPVLKAWSANGTIYVGGEAQAIDVYDMSGRTVFSGVASQVNGLSKGLYLVKVKNTVAKVAVK